MVAHLRRRVCRQLEKSQRTIWLAVPLGRHGTLRCVVLMAAMQINQEQLDELDAIRKIRADRYRYSQRKAVVNIPTHLVVDI